MVAETMTGLEKVVSRFKDEGTRHLGWSGLELHWSCSLLLVNRFEDSHMTVIKSDMFSESSQSAK